MASCSLPRTCSPVPPVRNWPLHPRLFRFIDSLAISIIPCCAPPLFSPLSFFIWPLTFLTSLLYASFFSSHPIPSHPIPCHVMSWNAMPLISNSSLNREFFSDVSWTLSMYLEAVAMLPQIYMFQKQASDQGGIVEVSTYYASHLYANAIGCSDSVTLNIWCMVWIAK